MAWGWLMGAWVAPSGAQKVVTMGPICPSQGEALG